MTKFKPGNMVELVDASGFPQRKPGEQYVVKYVVQAHSGTRTQVWVFDDYLHNGKPVMFYAYRLKLVDAPSEDWGPSVVQAWVDNVPDTVMVELPRDVVEYYARTGYNFSLHGPAAVQFACKKALNDYS